MCTTCRRAVSSETVSHNTWISSPSVKTVCTTVSLHFTLINGDTPGFAKYCGKKESRKIFTLRSSSTLLSIRSCFSRTTNFDRHSRFAPSRVNLSCFQSLDRHIAFLHLPQSACFTLAAPVVTVRGFPNATVWPVSTAWWNWHYLHLHLPCVEQHWIGQSARASFRNRICRHSTDFPML